MKKISKSEEFLDKLKKENKVEVLPTKPDSKFLKQVKRDFLKKDFESEQSAANTIVG